MKAHYLVTIDRPEHHHVRVSLKFKRPNAKKCQLFLPSWSPGSYLMREYARHVRWMEVTQGNGEVLMFSQKEKGIWEIDFEGSSVKTPSEDVEVRYDVYCKELTVRTSHVDASHAFLHGPSYLMGIFGEKLERPTIEFRFPPSWSKLSTGMKDISQKRDVFLYEAPDYDELIDSPVEIGCHETDGFEFLGKSHFIASYGELYPHRQNLKEDLKKVVETVARHFDNDLPYEQYLFINHFVPKIYGGLEHLNSTALHFDGRKLGNRKDYLTYLSLAGHEYFHLWNVKRIRPQEHGPFDYLNEGYSTLLWLSEGLTSFMDDLFLYRAGLSTLEEYLDVVRGNLDVYLSTPGRYYHSLEQSSFNAWVKLYRPDENSKNSSVSYYLKGGLVFTVLHSLLQKKGKGIDDLLKMLWADYKKRPERGVTKDEVYAMVKSLGDDEILNSFSTMVETTQDINFDAAFKSMGLELKFSDGNAAWLGADLEFFSDRVVVKSVPLDTPAHKGGLNAGDEIVFLNGLRFFREDAEKITSMLLVDQPYEFIVARLGRLTRLEITPIKGPRSLKEISIIDRALAERCLNFRQ